MDESGDPYVLRKGQRQWRRLTHASEAACAEGSLSGRQHERMASRKVASAEVSQGSRRQRLSKVVQRSRVRRAHTHVESAMSRMSLFS